MGLFEIEGSARREMECDIAKVVITFRATGKNAHEVSGKVMDQCDSFLELMSKAGMKTENFIYGEDRVDELRYSDDKGVYAERSINTIVPFDMKCINLIQSALQEGKYDYEISIHGDLSNRATLRVELAKEALKNSRDEAEQLAEVLGIKVKGVESIRKDSWNDSCDDDGCDEAEIVNCCCKMGAPRTSDNLGKATTEVSENLKVKWILE